MQSPPARIGGAVGWIGSGGLAPVMVDKGAGPARSVRIRDDFRGSGGAGARTLAGASAFVRAQR
ncbi:MAG: hypothetical protein FJ256_03930 [Phycisphaerae bacterium]|nr:hypothetical protein [Phycisphaerae bacterium]